MPDPNLFHIDWNQLTEVLGAIIVLAFFVERALSLVFEHRLFVARFSGKGVKEFIAFGVSALICVRWQFDALSVIILDHEPDPVGYFVTAAVIAGGSKASIKLFHDLMNVKSDVQRELDDKVGKKDRAPTSDPRGEE